MGFKRILAVLGACGLIIGLIALSSSAVQAEKGANWMVEGKNLEGLEPEVILSNVVAGGMTLHSKVLGIKFDLKCAKAQFIGAKLQTEGRVSSGNKTKFSECETFLNGAASPECTPQTGGEKGTFVSNALKGLLVLHELAGGAKDTLISFEPVEGSTFVTISLGATCPIGSTCSIIGKSTVKDGENLFGFELIEHLVEQGPLSELWVNSKTAEHVATILGSAHLKLAGVHAGKKWSALPG
jgi:hypothetical protein